MQACFDMISRRPAQLMRLADYGLEPGKAADLLVLDGTDPVTVIAELNPVLYAFKRGRMTVSRTPAKLHRPNS
jgi:cytosine deaminase